MKEERMKIRDREKRRKPKTPTFKTSRNKKIPFIDSNHTQDVFTTRKVIFLKLISHSFCKVRKYRHVYLAARHMALFSASRARFSAGDRSLSGATASSGLCMRSLS